MASPNLKIPPNSEIEIKVVIPLQNVECGSLRITFQMYSPGLNTFDYYLKK